MLRIIWPFNKPVLAIRIHVIYNVDQEIMEAKLPKFTLQPLVENAIVHGLEPKIDGGDLAINAKKNGENIILSIIDTGVGIPVSKLNNLLEFQSNSDKTENVTAIGMKNVHQRIQSYFGPNYGLKVDSQQGRGCQVTVTLPLYGLARGDRAVFKMLIADDEKLEE